MGFQCEQVRLAHSTLEFRYLPAINIIRKTQAVDYPVLRQSQAITYLSQLLRQEFRLSTYPFSQKLLAPISSSNVMHGCMIFAYKTCGSAEVTT